MNRDPNCRLCKLSATCQTVCLLGDGPQPCDIMIIGEAPGQTEDKLGLPFVGKSGKLIDEWLDAADIDRKDVYVCNAVSCRPPDNKKPTKAQIRSCKHWLDYQISIVKPKFVLLLGNTPLQSITGSPGIKSKRGRPFEKDDIIFLPTYHPAFTFHDPDWIPVIKQDIRLFKQIIDKGEIPRESNLRPNLVLNMGDFRRMLDALHGHVSFDIETNGLYPWASDARVTMIGFGTADGEFSIPTDFFEESPWTADAIDDMLPQIEERLEDCVVSMHNGKFDTLWMWVIYGVKWYGHIDFDTMLAHYALDENSRHGLKELAQKFCGAPDWDIDKDKKQGNTSLKKLGLYHAHDLYYTRQLKSILERQIKSDPLVYDVFKHIIMPCARLFVEIEYDGVFIDVTKFDEAEQYLHSEVEAAETELAKYGNINWGSPQQVAKLLFEDLGIDIIDKTPTGNPSTSESVIQRIDHPCAGAILRYRAAHQQLSFFIDGWKPFIHKMKIDGEVHHYLHPSFKLHGTVTGRLSCEHPNLQQVPRDERIRSLITAPPGWTLIECDLSQIELRVAAELANERRMIWAFMNDVDIHWLTAMREIERGGALKDLVIDTAATLTQNKSIRYAEAIEVLLKVGPDAAVEVNKEWKEYRKKAKAINFGYLFGMWWRKFKLYARDNYGVDVTDKEAQDSRKYFFTEYSDLPTWHNRQQRFAKLNGYVRSLSGRKRRLPKALLVEDTPERREALRQAINSPVQSFANELNLMAALQLRKEFGRDVVRICGTVHDAILARVRNDYVERVTTRLLEIMSHPELMDVLDIKFTVPIIAEAKIGPWSQGKGLKKWLAERSTSQVRGAISTMRPSSRR